MNITKIDWCDRSYNPVTGCEHNCSYCYARAIHTRFKRTWKPTFHPERLDQPLKTKRPQRIFVCSMADLFGRWVPQQWIDKVLDVVRRAPQHHFLFLTKNPERLATITWGANCWVGATAVDQEAYDRAALAMQLVDAPVRFISAEPMLKPVIMDGHKWKPDWLIIGSLGTKKGATRQVWAERLTMASARHGIPCFHKSNLNCVATEDHLHEFPRPHPSDPPRGAIMY